MDALTLTSCALAFALYYNTLDAGFVYDDSRAILTNQDVLPSTPLLRVWQDDFWGTPLGHSGSHKSYRPLTVLTFRFNYLLHGFRPQGYHLFNVLLHCLATALVVRVGRLLFGPRRPVAVAVAAATFAAHPVHTEAVAGVVGRADMAACVFFLLSLLSYAAHVRLRERLETSNHPLLAARKWTLLVAALLLAACAGLAKEHGLTVLVVCALYDLTRHLSRYPDFNLAHLFTKRANRGLSESLLVLAASLGLLLQARLYLMGGQVPEFASCDNPAARSKSLTTRFLTFAYLPAFNLLLMVFPKWLSFDWSMEAIPRVKSVSDPRNLLSVLLYYALFRAGCRLLTLLRRPQRPCRPPKLPKRCTVCHFSSASGGHNNNHPSPKLAAKILTPPRAPKGAEAALVGLGVLCVPFVPASNLFFYVGFVVAERVLYIPSVGYCLLLGQGAGELWRRAAPTQRRALFVAALVLLAAFSVRTVQRNKDWSCEENLYRSGIPINPPKSYGNLGNVLSSQGRLVEAEWAYRKALSHRSNMADVHYNLGILLQGRGLNEQAIESYQRAIHFRPRLAVAHLNLGHALEQVGRSEEAVDVYRACASLDGTGLKDPKTHEATKISALFHLGRLHADQGRFNQAATIYREAIDKMPDYYQAQSLYNMLGEAHYRLNEFAEAERWYKAALQAKPDHVPAHLTYGKMLAKNKTRLLEAEQWFMRAKQLAPNDSSVYQHFGQFLSELERHEEAAQNYVRAAELAPDDYEIVFNAANALRQSGQLAEAERFYRHAVTLRPKDASSHMNLGAMLHLNGKYAQAEAAYLEALRLKPDDDTTLTNLQKLYGLLSRLKHA
ncbi:protein O-mannosyl-transferase TMTC2 [Neocloeon triangulifer]|uniref:protein O-mannosyl-transferase TMTC2 n=1 Tax=Neocloeon triangulifer TaxID=2078957 RepID=UPI00286F43D8|nr:protein O-mannosyl-transferase TMTC2 [Neocloeon triangulifer]